jgi:hypothetical protein
MTTTAATHAAYPGHMATATTATAEKLAALCEALRGQVIAGVRVHEVTAEVKPGSDGEPIVRLRLIVTDPARGRDTWPVETVRSIEQRARDEAWKRGLAEWVYVTLIGQNEAAENDEDPAADDALSRGLSRGFDQVRIITT